MRNKADETFVTGRTVLLSGSSGVITVRFGTKLRYGWILTKSTIRNYVRNF